MLGQPQAGYGHLGLCKGRDLVSLLLSRTETCAGPKGNCHRCSGIEAIKPSLPPSSPGTTLSKACSCPGYEGELGNFLEEGTIHGNNKSFMILDYLLCLALRRGQFFITICPRREDAGCCLPPGPGVPLLSSSSSSSPFLFTQGRVPFGKVQLSRYESAQAGDK